MSAAITTHHTGKQDKKKASVSVLSMLLPDPVATLVGMHSERKGFWKGKGDCHGMQYCRGPSETKLNIVLTNGYLHPKCAVQEFLLLPFINQTRVSICEDDYESA